MPVCLQSPPAAASTIIADYLGNGKKDRGGNKGTEYVHGVAQSQKGEDNIISLQGGMSCA